MEITPENKLRKIIIVGDPVLIRVKTPDEKTLGGLYLPPSVHEKEQVQSGYVVKVGPGYPVSIPADEIEESWKEVEDKVRYIPLQVKEGDHALFLQKGAYEVMYENEKYYIVPQHVILMLVRDEDLFT
jgi:chaperonin GroES